VNSERYIRPLQVVHRFLVLFTIKKSMRAGEFRHYLIIIGNSYGPVENNAKLLTPAQNTNYQGI